MMYLLACYQLGSMLCFENIAVWISDFFHTAWYLDCFWETCHVEENTDSPCVFEFWITNMLREVSMRMFSSFGDTRNVLRGPKQNPDVFTAFWLPCWCTTSVHQHGVSMLNLINLSGNLCRITPDQNIAQPRNFGVLFIFTPLHHLNFLTLYFKW